MYFICRHRSWVLMTVQKRILSECSLRKTEQSWISSVHVVVMPSAFMMKFDAELIAASFSYSVDSIVG